MSPTNETRTVLHAVIPILFLGKSYSTTPNEDMQGWEEGQDTVAIYKYTHVRTVTNTQQQQFGQQRTRKASLDFSGFQRSFLEQQHMVTPNQTAQSRTQAAWPRKQLYLLTKSQVTWWPGAVLLPRSLENVWTDEDKRENWKREPAVSSMRYGTEEW